MWFTSLTQCSFSSILLPQLPRHRSMPTTEHLARDLVGALEVAAAMVVEAALLLVEGRLAEWTT